MKQKLNWLIYRISKFHIKKVCKTIFITIFYTLLLSSCFAKPSNSDSTTTKEAKQQQEIEKRKEKMTELLKEQEETPSDSIKKKVKKLDNEGNEVYTILFDEIKNIYTKDKSLEKLDTFHNIKRLCELYQENYPDNQNTKIIVDILNTITTHHDNEIKLIDLNSMYPNGIEESFNNLEYKEFYIVRKLETKYKDNIYGLVQKGQEFFKEEKNEFFATDVKYNSFWGEIADDTSSYVIQPISSFPKDGVYNLYVIKNGSRTLVDYNGFQSEAPVYRQVDVDILNKNLETYYNILEEQDKLQKQLGTRKSIFTNNPCKIRGVN